MLTLILRTVSSRWYQSQRLVILGW